MASAIEGRFKSRIDKSTVSLNGEVRTAADVEDRLLSDIHILSLSLSSSLPLLSLAYVRSCTRAYACRRLWNEFAMFLHARFLSSSAVLSLSLLSASPVFTRWTSHFADLPESCSETDRVSENVVACLASRPQLPNSGGDGGGYARAHVPR